MSKVKRYFTIGVIGFALTAGLTSLPAQAVDTHCEITARGTTEYGVQFFGRATIDTAFNATPGSVWRHFERDASGALVISFLGRVEFGLCTPNGRTIVQVWGIGRLNGSPVEFEVFGRDGSPDEYSIRIRDTAGDIIYEMSPRVLATGDISAIMP